MNFNSLEFLIFLPVVVFLYWILPHRVRWVLLLIASYFFYMSWNPELIFLILGTTLVSYFGGIIIGKTENKKVRKAVMLIAVLLCLIVLVVFKYLDFLLGSVYFFIRLGNPEFDGILFNLILPVGISFYTFQTLSYVIDVYRGTVQPEKHFGYYALFVSFFPQLVAGPIERPENLLPQLKEKHDICFGDFDEGFKFLLSGFIKKVVVADYIGTLVDYTYANSAEANGLALLLASVLFFVQVYCDFSGYSDIATGAARMMGIKLMKNFKWPFLATSFSEMWSGWHISLSSWFNDYVQTPLNYRAMNSKHLSFRLYLNLFIVLLLCGLWHGASWTYVFWGLLIAVVLTLEKIITPKVKKVAKKKNINLKAGWYLWTKRILLIFFSGLLSVFFRAGDIFQAFEVYGKIFTGFLSGGFLSTFAGMNAGITEAFLIPAVLVLLAFNRYLTGDVKKLPSKALPAVSLTEEKEMMPLKAFVCFMAVAVIALAWFMLISGDIESAFVYFQF